MSNTNSASSRTHLLVILSTLTLIVSLVLITSAILKESRTEQLFKQVTDLIEVLKPETDPEPEVEIDSAGVVSVIDPKELKCLAENIYHEAAVESELGKIAVAMVTLNRVASSDFPNTICEVVYQPSKAPGRPKACQFSWTCDGKSDNIRSQSVYQEIKILARDILSNKDNIYDIVDGALHYHAVYVSPKWAKYFTKVARIDTHIFYKNKPKT